MHVERARRYARERGHRGDVRFEQADYTDTGFDASSFDVAWAQESACHTPDKQAFCEETFRVLRTRSYFSSCMSVPMRSMASRSPPKHWLETQKAGATQPDCGVRQFSPRSGA